MQSLRPDFNHPLYGAARFRPQAPRAAPQVNREDYARMRDLMEQCHDHKNRKCTCATHRRLREVDPLTLVSVINSFRVEWVGP